MSVCNFYGTIAYDCDDKKLAIGGAKLRVFVGNLSDLQTKIDFSDVSQDITSLNFKAYKGLYEINTVRNGVEASDSATKEANGAMRYTHQVILKLLLENSLNRDIAERLLNADDLFFIIERNSGRFEVFGGEAGLEATQETRNLGFTATGADTSSTCTFVSEEESHLPRFFWDTDYSTTLAKLESYLV
ncbi:MAG: hypothetical protein QXW79_02445 [Thermoplasmata archaeon]